MQGYVKLYRDILNHAIAHNGNLLGFYCYLLLRVNHTTQSLYIGTKKITIQAGQCILSQKKLSIFFTVSISTINRRLCLLKDEQLLEIKTTNKYTILTILNRHLQHPNRNQIESKSQSDRKQIETNKNDKECYNNEKKINAILKKLQTKSQQLEIAYNPTDENQYSQLLLTEKHFGDQAEHMHMSRCELALAIMERSCQLDFRKGPCSGPKLIFDNYAEVINFHKRTITSPIEKIIVEQPKHIQKKLLEIQKQRKQSFPYKSPFVSVVHLQSFIAAIKKGEL